MRRLTLKGALLAGLAMGLLATPALAQNREKAWEINPYAGLLSFDKVDGQKVLNDTWDVGFRFGYNWTKHHEVEFGFYGASTSNGEGLDLNADILGGQVNYDYNFFMQHRGKVVGLATAGIGVLNISSFGFVENPDLVGDKLEVSYNFGVGIRFFGGPRAGFRMDLRRESFSDQGVTLNFYEFTAGMTIVLGGA
jgi:Outer membrane protein beta-barrel domain